MWGDFMSNQQALKRKLYYMSQRDGLTELFTGAFFFFYSSIIMSLLDFSSDAKKTALFAFVFAFSGPIIQFMRKHFTYSQSGYVKGKAEITKPYLFLVVFPIAFFPAIIGVFLHVFHFDAFIGSLISFSPLIFGILFFFYYWYQYRSGAGFFYSIFAFVSIILGILIFIFNNQLQIEGYFAFFTINGAVLVLFGIYKLITFMKQVDSSERK